MDRRALLGLGLAAALSGCFLDRSGVVGGDAGQGTDTGPELECENDEDCDDGVFCNGFEICSAFTCTTGAPPACADAVACTLDVCDEVADGCVRLPDHALCEADELCVLDSGCTPREPCSSDADCDDGFACNGPEQCDDGACAAGSIPTCDDGVDCTVDACSETRRGCVNVPDDDACPGEPVCDVRNGCVPPVLCTSDAECDDGNFCDGAERCVSGRCENGAPPSCVDTIACTVDVCDELTDACLNLPLHTQCPLDQECLVPGGCTLVGDCAIPADCDDGFFCNGVEGCTSGRCVGGTAPSCADATACTRDLCDEAGDRCRNLADDTLCAVNHACDVVMGCVPECTGASDCDDSVFCNGAETCVLGGCVAGTAPDCADTVTCTNDLCDETANTCRHLPSDTTCAANERCDVSAGCVPECTGASDCDDGLLCNGAETCVLGGCVAGTPASCNDGIPCTIDVCDELGDLCRWIANDAACGANETCSLTLGCVPECTGAPDCDDGLFCNGTETCAAGGCVAGTPPSCGDGIPCTTDVCDELGDQCRWIPSDAACGANETCSPTLGCVPECTGAPDCDDGLFCNGAETCAGGGCVAGTPPSCTDGIDCTVDLCDESGDRCLWFFDDMLCPATEVCTTTGCAPS